MLFGLLVSLALGVSAQAQSSLTCSGGQCGAVSTVLSNTAVSTTIGTTATLTYFNLSAQIPANTLSAGKVVTFDIAGPYSANATDTVIIGIAACKVSGCGSGVVVQWATSAAVTMLGVTNDYWAFHSQSSVFTAGTSGTVNTQGYSNIFTAGTTIVNGQAVNTTTTLIDTTVIEFLTPFVKFSTASASDAIAIGTFKVVIE